jgi:hypothetical protein
MRKRKNSKIGLAVSFSPPLFRRAGANWIKGNISREIYVVVCRVRPSVACRRGRWIEDIADKPPWTKSCPRRVPRLLENL